MKRKQNRPEALEKRSASSKKQKGKGEQKNNYPTGLTKEEKKRLKELRARKIETKKKKRPETVQDSLPYQEIYKDGICQMEGGKFSKMIQFFDINYELAGNEEKSVIFDAYCELLNYFDSSINIQITFLNQQVNPDEYANSIHIPLKGDGFDELRKEYSEIIRMQMEKGNNGLVRSKYITFTIKAASRREAKIKLERVETELLNHFKNMGAKAVPINGAERLKILHDILNHDTKEPFYFDYRMITETGLGTKDFIAPTGFDFRSDDHFRMGKTYGCMSYVQINCAELTDKTLFELLDMEENLILNLHIKPIDPEEAIKGLKNKLSDIQKMKIEEQKKALRNGYDMDLIPTDLVTYGEDAGILLKNVMSRDEKMFEVTFLVMNLADSKKKLDAVTMQTTGILQKHNCGFRNMQYLQEQGLMSSLPFGLNQSGIYRHLTTETMAILMPFKTPELFMGGEAFYYGVNAQSSNLIMADRKELNSPNGVYIGKTGFGKSFAAKREFLNAALVTEDDIIISDPEGEYAPLVRALKGQHIKISATSPDHINPMDVNLDVVYHPEKYRGSGDAEDIEMLIADKSEFMMSFCEVIMWKPQHEELDGKERSVIDHCVRVIYEKYLYNDPKTENMPILQDFQEQLLICAAQGNEAAALIASYMELYVSGSQNVFNHRTNVNMNNRIICFESRELGATLRKAAMLIVQSMVWTRVSSNRVKKKYTRYYADEFHLLLKQPQTANYCVEIWKRFRKYGGIATAITQDVLDFMSSPVVENILGNSEFIYMLNQHAGNQKVLAERLNLSEQQLSFVNNSAEGSGLLIFGDVVIPFVDRYPKDTRTYKLMSTKLMEQEETR